ncbi:FkbM family methyltransferase [Halospeciosus flavus]|uniref:FkbM family methyltransferase n=1 Tax=Halospeciosus flavus TaxID=3032283 RepID=UPI003605ED58
MRLKVPRDHPFLEKSNKPGGHEPALTKELEMIIDEETVFYDIGARFGYHTVLSMMLGVPENQIHAFEGHPVPFSVLEENHKDSAFLTNSYVGDGSKNLSLDDYISRNQDPTVLKIDVEGAEVDVLRGQQTSSQNRDQKYISKSIHIKFTDQMEMWMTYTICSDQSDISCPYSIIEPQILFGKILTGRTQSERRYICFEGDAKLSPVLIVRYLSL